MGFNHVLYTSGLLSIPSQFLSSHLTLPRRRHGRLPRLSALTEPASLLLWSYTTVARDEARRTDPQTLFRHFSVSGASPTSSLLLYVLHLFFVSTIESARPSAALRPTQ